MDGQPPRVRKARARAERVDFREIFGLTPGRPQACAFRELDVPADGQATIIYDADWRIQRPPNVGGQTVVLENVTRP